MAEASSSLLAWPPARELVIEWPELVRAVTSGADPRDSSPEAA